jgi:diguanylate cyclase (GGDEF)-like protein
VAQKLGAGFGLALLVMLAVGVVSYHTIGVQVETAARVARTQHIIAHLAELGSQVDDIESGARGFVITLHESYLEPYYRGIYRINSTIQELGNLTEGDPVKGRRFAELKSFIDARVALAQQVVNVRRNQGLDAAVQLIQAGRGKQLMDEIDRRTEEMAGDEQNLLLQSEVHAQDSARRTFYSLVVGGALCILILSLAGVIIFRDMTQKKEAEQALQRANTELVQSLSKLEQHSLEISRLSEIGDLLHSCQTTDEAYRVIAQSIPRVIPDTSGALGLIDPSRNLVEQVVAWGEPQLGEPIFPPGDCWALRRGRMNYVEDTGSPLHCKHLGGAKPAGYLCVPLMAHGEALGLMHLQADRRHDAGELSSWMPEASQRLATTVGGQIALAVSNLRLREALRQQSVRDPLTGLFNRRYMEESLGLELRRAVRSSRPLSVLMLDLDHFKSFNDSFGHDAGDTMLREFGTVLKGVIRQGDIACRCGGEEFALILPDASLEVSRLRAERLRESVKHLSVQHRGQGLGNVTVSIGIAAFPEHGGDLDTLLKAADTALYSAKEAGRDRVTPASIPEMSPNI